MIEFHDRQPVNKLWHSEADFAMPDNKATFSVFSECKQLKAFQNTQMVEPKTKRVNRVKISFYCPSSQPGTFVMQEFINRDFYFESLILSLESRMLD